MWQTPVSNGSPKMLDAAVEAGKLELDAVLSVDAVRRYKPRPEVYAMVAERFSAKPDDIIFISSNRWDVMGASAFGFRTLWVNRAGNPDEYADFRPNAMVKGLEELQTIAV